MSPLLSHAGKVEMLLRYYYLIPMRTQNTPGVDYTGSGSWGWF